MDPIETALRVYSNIDVLLHEGNFPGKYAAEVAEARQFVQNLSQILKEQLSGQPDQETGTSDRSEEGAGGLGNDDIRAEGRPSRKRKPKRA